MIQLPAVEIRKQGREISFTLPRAFEDVVNAFFATLHGWAGVTLSKPKKPRTTGWKSQNHHINGHCQQISAATGCSFEAVKMRMKQLTPGWPHDTLADGSGWPKSESEATTAEAAALIETIHAFAAEYGIILIEDNQ